MKKIVFSVAVVLASIVADAFITDYVTTGCTPGVWTYDLSAAKAYAKKTGRFYIYIFAKSGGCAYCRNAAEQIWNVKEFRSWASENKIPLVYGDYSAGCAAAKTFYNTYCDVDQGTGIPVIAFIDGQDSVAALGYAVLHSSSIYGLDFRVAAEAGGEGIYVGALSANTPKQMVTVYLNHRDDLPYKSTKTSVDYGKRPTEISADALKATNLTTNGLLGDWEVNTLGSKFYMSGSMIMCYVDDRQDWYKFTNAKEQSYIVKCPTMVDKSGLGYLGVYTSAAKAKKAADALAAAGVGKLPDAVKSNAAQWIPMSDLKAGRAFVVPKGDIYLCFCRRAAKSKENITLKYTFTLQQGVLDSFEFDAAAKSFDEYDATKVQWETAPSVITNDCELTVCRDTTGTETTATVTFADGTAKKGTDYLVTATTATFKSSSKTATLPFKIISKRGLWVGDRAFTVSIAKDAKSGSSKTKQTVTIKEVDPAKDDDDPANDARSGATALSLAGATITNRLNGVTADGYDDQMDWFKFTGRDANKIACLKFKPLVKSYSKNSFVLKFFKDGQEIVLPESHSTEVTGMDAFTVALPPQYFPQSADIHLCVSNKTAQASHCGLYELSVFQIDQMVASFADVPAQVAYDSPRAPSNVAYRVVMTTNMVSHAEYFDDWKLYLPTWRTVDGTAENGIDFKGTSAEGSELAKDGDRVVAKWDLLVAPKFRPDRTLTVELLPDPYGYYRLGEKPSVAVTIKGDNAIPAEPFEEGVGETFVKATDRNLNYTNTIDNVYYSNIVAGVDYVLGAENILIKPVGSAVNVAVYTNLNFATPLWLASPVTNKVQLSTNEVGVATNCYDALCAELKTALPREWCATNEFGVETNCFWLTIDATNTVFAEYGCVVSNVLAASTNMTPYGSAKHAKTKIVRNYCEATNDCKWVRFAQPDGTKQWPLADLADPAKMPILTFTDDGTVRIKVWRTADESVLCEYDLMLTEWMKPTLNFTKSCWTNNQTEAVCAYGVELSETTQLPMVFKATLSCGTARAGVDVEAFTDRLFTVPAGETSASVIVTNLMAEAARKGVWAGDRDFTLTLVADDPKVKLGAMNTATGVLQSVTPEYEEGDTKDETTNNPMVKDEPTDKEKGYDRTMNGADTKDCFWITNVVAGTTYRFRLEYRNGTTNNLDGTGFKTITFTVDGTDRNVKVSDILNADYDVAPTQDGIIKIRIDRSGDSTAAKPISLGYTLKVREWPWPTFAFETAQLGATNLGEATNVTFVIKRTENCEGTNWVKVTLAALTNNAVSATSPAIGTTEKFVFLPEQTETNWTVSVVTPALTPQGVWTGDWAFQANLAVETDETKDKVRLGDITNCVVTVTDVIAERDWHDACGDDDWQTLTTNETITPLVKTLPECRLNGSDYADWYRFTGIESNATYYIECTVGKTNNLSKSGVTLTYFHYSAEGTWEELTPKATGAVTVDSDNDLYVCVSRQVRGEKYHVSAAYTLSFHRVSAGVYLTPGAVKVNENMNYATVEVVCTNTTDLVLPVVAVVRAETQPGDTATAPSDYEAICVTNVWEEGPVGGARTIKIPLTNRDTMWEGDETFHVRLTVESGAEGVHLPELGLSTNVLVTIEEKNEPQYGTVAITEAGEPLASVKNAATTLWPAREGDTVNVRLKRRGGVTGQVVLKWYWKDAAGTTVKYANGSSYFYTTNFYSGEKGYGAVMPIPVPVKSGALVAENWTLAYKIDTTRGAPATVYTGSPTALNFIVTDQYYGDSLDSYSAGDRSKIAFSATGETWFKGLSDGVVRSTTPASGSSVAMTAKVTGPGTLKFGATFTEVVAGYLKVTGGDASVTIKTDGLYSVHVSAGTKTLTFTFKRSAKDGANAAVAIDGVTFVPDSAFNRYGTFTGPVSVEGVAGLATLTVSSAGKTSGKFQCADRVWTISTNGAWNAAGVMSVTAKSGKFRKNVAFRLDDDSGVVTNGASDGVALGLARKVWSDKPVATNRVELLTTFVGRYTANLAYTEVEEKLDAGALAIRLAKGGTVTVAGTLSDGTAVSASVPLVFTQESIPWAYLFAAPSDYKKGWFALPFGFVDDVGTLKVGRLPTAPIGIDDVNWKSKAKDDAFERVVVIE